jgi:hypothetical protein
MKSGRASMKKHYQHHKSSGLEEKTAYFYSLLHVQCRIPRCDNKKQKALPTR